MLTPARSGTLSRGPLRAGAVVLSCLLGGVAAATARGGPARRGAVAATVATVVAVPGITRPRLARRPVLAWEEGSRRVADLLTTYVAWVTHATALPPGEDVERRPDADRRGSRWGPPTVPAEAAWGSLSVDPADAPGPPARVVRRWLRRRGGPRATWLAVCLTTLRWVRADDRPGVVEEPPSQIYTLY